MRKTGFPSLLIKECKNYQLVRCREEILKEEKKGIHIVNKVEYIQKSVCEGCSFLFKIQSDKQASNIVLHLKSGNSMFQLKEHEITTDFMHGLEQNNYEWTHITSKPLVLDIHVLEGNLKATISNGKGLYRQKQSSDNQKLIDFYIQEENQQSISILTDNQTLLNSFDLSHNFRNYILTLQNTEQNQSCIYSLVYSSGNSTIYFQDGLITDITIEHGRPTTFYYFKQSKESIYLTISIKNATNVNVIPIQITSFYYDDQDP